MPTFTAYIFLFIYSSVKNIVLSSTYIPLFKYSRSQFHCTHHPPAHSVSFVLPITMPALERNIRIFLSTANNLCSTRILIFILKGRALQTERQLHLRVVGRKWGRATYKITDFPNRNSVITDRRGISIHVGGSSAREILLDKCILITIFFLFTIYREKS